MIETFWQELPRIGQVALAAALGGVIGMERAWSGKPAGVRTHMAVSLGAAVASNAGLGFQDATRIAAQVITGIGFLGAALVIRDQGSVRGLTSAASIWAVAAVGIAVGLGWSFLGIAATLILLLALAPLESFERRLIRGPAARRWRLTLRLAPARDPLTLSAWKRYDLTPKQVSVQATPEGNRAVVDVVVPPTLSPQDLITALLDAGAAEVEWTSLTAVAEESD